MSSSPNRVVTGSTPIRRRLRAACAALAFVGGASCVGDIGSGGSGASSSTQPPGEAEQPLECVDAKLSPGPSPLRRLTRADYDNTVRDLLGDTTHPASSF